MFQSTHPHGVRLSVFSLAFFTSFCFNPRTHTGCDNAWSKALPPRRVSIHAPTRGATFISFHRAFLGGFNPRTHTGCDLLSGGLSTQAIVSIHAPTRGATTAILAISESGSLFQSTHPHGVRQCINTTYVRVACFNPRTHTGCDTYQTLHACADSVSIHAPTRGATSIISLAWSGIEFQSTHPHGVRLIAFPVPTIFNSFNPRTHTGCDLYQKKILPLPL